MLRALRRLLSSALMRWDSSDARGGSTDSATASVDCPGPASNTCTHQQQRQINRSRCNILIRPQE